MGRGPDAFKKRPAQAHLKKHCRRAAAWFDARLPVLGVPGVLGVPFGYIAPCPFLDAMPTGSARSAMYCINITLDIFRFS